jgi:hypothetical protein
MITPLMTSLPLATCHGAQLVWEKSAGAQHMSRYCCMLGVQVCVPLIAPDSAACTQDHQFVRLLLLLLPLLGIISPLLLQCSLLKLVDAGGTSTAGSGLQCRTGKVCPCGTCVCGLSQQHGHAP